MEDSVNIYVDNHDYDETKSENWSSVESLFRETDLEVIESEENLICPITMQTLKDPVKRYSNNSLYYFNVVYSIKCSGNHRYSKDAIYQLISQSDDNYVKCPVAGCNKRISKKDLVKDDEAIALLNRGLNKYRNRNVFIYNIYINNNYY